MKVSKLIYFLIYSFVVFPDSDSDESEQEEDLETLEIWQCTSEGCNAKVKVDVKKQQILLQDDIIGEAEHKCKPCLVMKL